MVIAAIIGVCVLLLVLGFLVPRLSRGPQRGVDATMDAGQRAGGKAPGPLGKLFSKSFGSSRKAAAKSAGTGRRGRGKLPLQEPVSPFWGAGAPSSLVASSASPSEVPLAAGSACGV